MGWSCSAIASKVMEALEVQLGCDELGSNAWTAKGKKYFHETSRREHDDGAITGTVQRIIGGMETGGGTERCHAVGSFKINGDGTIARFPTSTKAQRKAAQIGGLARFAEYHPQEAEALYSHLAA